jgi:hypothetical protein
MVEIIFFKKSCSFFFLMRGSVEKTTSKELCSNKKTMIIVWHEVLLDLKKMSRVLDLRLLSFMFVELI